MASWLDAITGPLSTVTKSLQELMEVRDLVKFGDTFRKMHADVLAAQSSAVAGYHREASLLDEIGQLKKRVADFETWETEKQRYELKDLGNGCFVRMLKRNARGIEPPHWICDHCYQKRAVSIIQFGENAIGTKTIRRGWYCPACHNYVNARTSPQWLD